MNLSSIKPNFSTANTANTLVQRDASGNFSAGTITAALSGNSSSATKLATSRSISLTGAVTGAVSFDGSSNVSIVTTTGLNSATKAWVSFNASGSVRSSFNVSSVSRTAEGQYTVNFTSAFPDTAYCFVIGVAGKSDLTDSATSPYEQHNQAVVTFLATNRLQIQHGDTYNNSREDCQVIGIAIFD